MDGTGRELRQSDGLGTGVIAVPRQDSKLRHRPQQSNNFSDCHKIRGFYCRTIRFGAVPVLELLVSSHCFPATPGIGPASTAKLTSLRHFGIPHRRRTRPSRGGRPFNTDALTEPAVKTAPARPPTCPRRSRTSGSTPAGCRKRKNPASVLRKRRHRNGRAKAVMGKACL